MLRAFLFASAVLQLFTMATFGSERRLCFSRDQAIWLSNLNGTGAGKVTTGTDPSISANGNQIAYTEPGKQTDRHIAVIDLGSRAKSVFRNLPSQNAYGPVWSPDDKRLVFKIFVRDHWRLGLIQADGAGFQFIGELSPANQDFESPSWARDGKSLYCQDLTNLYQIDLDGRVLAQWKISESLVKASMSSNNRIQPSGDGSHLLLDADLDKDGPITKWEGPPPALFLFDITTGKAKQISPALLYAWEPCWLNEQEYVFTGTRDGTHFAIYKASLAGDAPRLLINNASGATVSK